MTRQSPREKIPSTDEQVAQCQWAFRSRRVHSDGRGFSVVHEMLLLRALRHDDHSSACAEPDVRTVDSATDRTFTSRRFIDLLGAHRTGDNSAGDDTETGNGYGAAAHRPAVASGPAAAPDSAASDLRTFFVLAVLPADRTAFLDSASGAPSADCFRFVFVAFFFSVQASEETRDEARIAASEAGGEEFIRKRALDEGGECVMA